MRNLRVDYDEVRAVDDLSVEIGPGEIYGLVGPNGAGKTSTLRALVGLVEPTYGDILIDGIDVEERHAEATRLIGFMPDSAPVYGDLTVWEYLDLFAASYAIPRDKRDAAINHHLELVDLTDKRNAMTAELSRGMRQRLILAKTLLPDPEILLLDEPASGLDPYGRALLKDVMRRLSADGKTVMISSHILAELSEFCTSIGIMERGRLVVSGSIDDIAATVFKRKHVMLVEVLPEEAPVETILADEPRVGEVQRTGNVFEFPFDGGAEEASDLLKSLVLKGVRVVSFAQRREDLEAVFLAVGAKEVS